MRKILSFSLAICALAMGFFFAGLPGAVSFGLLMLASFMVMRRKDLNSLDARWLFTGVFLCLTGYLLMRVFGLIGSDPRLHTKLRDIRVELQRQGYRPTWFIISQKRSTLYNAVLANSITKSKHLKGRAIDIFVVDVDGNGRYEMRDFELIQKASETCGRRNPSYKGRVYDYLDKKSRLTRHMVHVELE
jgi:hypothetical protein